jgi:Na+/H+-dicarboxylate symporter
MYGLPLGLLCLVAERVASTGGDLVFAMVRFIGAVYLGAAVLLAVGALAIWARVGGAFLGTLRAVKAPVLVGLGTSSPIAAIPSMLQAVAAGLRRDPVGANLAVPLGVNLYVPGSTCYFALAALFVAQIYGVALGWQEYLVLVVASVFAAVAAPDTPGPSGVGALVVVLDPLGIPASVGVILLSVVDPLVEPAVAVADVHGNCMAAALVVDPVGPGSMEDLGAGGVPGAPEALPGAVHIGGRGASHGA